MAKSSGTSKKQKKFLAKPEYDGGKLAMDEFIAKTLEYPKEASKKGVSGNVHVAYSVNENGDVTDAKVTRGIGTGCDEEALRVVRLLKFRRVRNAGSHIMLHTAIVIHFRLKKETAPISFVYEFQPSTPVELPTEPPKSLQNTVFTYTLTISQPQIEVENNKMDG